MDQFAYNSHQKASQAQKAGKFENEIVPIDVPGRRGKEGIVFSVDECVRHDATLEKMTKLKPVFKKDGGTVTAGNACGMPDGSAVMVMMSRAKAKSLGLTPLFSIVSYANTAVDNAYMGIGPGYSIPMALKAAGLTKDDIDAYEINEAFAATSIACNRIIGMDTNKVNINGGAIALGPPTGASGARIMVTLYNVLKQQGKELGAASLCGGGGVTCAIIIKREN